jgi:hypothetical protein
MGNATIPPPRPDDKLRELEAIHRQLAATHDVLVEIRDLLDDFSRIFLAARFRFGKPDDRFSRPPTWKRS